MDWTIKTEKVDVQSIQDHEVIVVLLVYLDWDPIKKRIFIVT